MRQYRKTRAILLNSCTIALIFFGGYIMGEASYRHKVLQALKAHDTDNAIRLCAEWSKSQAEECQQNPIYYLACMAQHAKNGHIKGVQSNLNKIVALIGE